LTAIHTVDAKGWRARSSCEIIFWIFKKYLILCFWRKCLNCCDNF
jgi:hypothetical protein